MFVCPVTSLRKGLFTPPHPGAPPAKPAVIHEMCCIYVYYIYSNYAVLVPIRYAVDEVDAALICIVSLCLCN